MALGSLLPSELELKKELVFITVLEDELVRNPNATLQSHMNDKLKPRIIELKQKIREEKIGKGKNR